MKNYTFEKNMKFKYQEELRQLNVPCPPDDYIATTVDLVYRWVFEEIEDERNFLPQFHRKPQRFLHKEDIDKCKGMGLSLFDNLEGAAQRFAELRDAIGDKVCKTLGTQIAQGSLEVSDGVSGKSERLGHFSHHPSSSAEFQHKFVIIQKL